MAEEKTLPCPFDGMVAGGSSERGGLEEIGIVTADTGAAMEGRETVQAPTRVPPQWAACAYRVCLWCWEFLSFSGGRDCGELL